MKGQPKNFIAGHQRRKSPHEYIEQDCGYTSPCWVWQRGYYDNGYGSATVPGGEGRSTVAHRVVYERERGPIPDGFELDHLCRNRACVNPDHLQPVRHPLNAQRGAKAKLTWAQVREMRQRATHGATQAELASVFGVSHGHVWKILAKTQWRESSAP